MAEKSKLARDIARDIDELRQLMYPPSARRLGNERSLIGRIADILDELRELMERSGKGKW